MISNGNPSGRLVLGTGNRKKAAELIELLAPLGLELKTLADLPEHQKVAEEGETFQANAELKATLQARHLKRWVLGEDSGLMVDALGGAPGVYSARYAGNNATDEQNNRRLLESLGDTPPDRRTARYVCHVCVADPTGEVQAESEATCEGRIAAAPAGTAGFGYDPLFVILEYHRTFGQLGETVKRALSHRARAIRQLLPLIGQLLAEGRWC